MKISKTIKKIFVNIQEIRHEIILRKDEKLWYLLMFGCFMMILGINVQQKTISELRAEVLECRGEYE